MDNLPDTPLPGSDPSPDPPDLPPPDLPPPDPGRWVIRRKAQVVAAVRSGALSLEQACGRYRLTVEEFLSWERRLARHGLDGLRSTRLKDYR